jgi:phosphoglycolate phosphatase
MNLYKTVIFDLDGTLLDTLQDLTNSVNYALRVNDLPERTLDEVRRFVGNGIRNLIKRATPDGEANPRFEAVFAAFKEHYAVHCQDETKAYEGIMELCRELKEQGVHTAIVSNKADFAVKELQKHYFDGVIDVAIGEKETVRKKPAPDTVFQSLKELGVDGEGAVYVGDSDVDIETAKNAGMDCISVTWGFRDEPFLKEHGASILAHNAEELKRLILG